MKKIKNLIAILCSAVLCFSFAACNGREDQGGTPNVTPGGDIPDDNNVTIIEPSDKQEHNFSVISNNNGKYVFKCADCNEQESVVISCALGTKNACSVEGSTVTFKGITENSTYNIYGKLHGNIVIDVADDYKFELEMSGLELYSHSQCPINVLGGDKVTLSAKKSTVNNIYDMRKAVAEDGIAASVYSACDLSVQGKGSLNIKSENNNGIRTKKDLTVKNLALQVDCKNNALRGDDSVTVESGDLVLIARTGDGIKTTESDVSKKGNQRGTVAVTGGNILVYAACDGIDAAYDVTVDQSNADVSLQIFTDKYSKYSGEVTAVADSVYYVRYNSTVYKYSIKFYNDESDAVWCNSGNAQKVGNYNYYAITKPSTSYEYMQLYIYNDAQQQGQDEQYVACTEELSVNTNYDTIALQSRGGGLAYGWTNYSTSTSQGGPGGFGGFDGNTDKGDHSTKGIKSSNRITISAGTVTVSAYDDALHASNLETLDNGESALGYVGISGGNVTLRSNDDGIHGDGDVAISGGTVNIVSSYEGIEGYTVRISGGNVSIFSTDDGVNGTVKSGTGIAVSGGILYVYASGDGVDCNSTTQYEGIHFSGGKTVIISTGRADSSIDTERGYKYTSGHVVAVCVSGGMSREAINCSNFSSIGTSKTINLAKDSNLVVDGVATVKMPASVNAFVVCLGKTNANITSAASSSNTQDSNGVYWSV